MTVGVVQVVFMTLTYIATLCETKPTGNGCTYEYIGCYKDKMRSRAYDDLYFSYRGSIPWNNPCTNYTPIVDKCCDELMKREIQNHYFGVQYYGECWTYSEAQAQDYSKYKKFDENSTRCAPHGECAERNVTEYVGKEFANAIYCAYQCGKVKVTPRIVNGQVSENHFPFMASLQLGGQHFCGATLISCRWLLTAAHCMKWTSGGGELEPLPNEQAELGSKQLGDGKTYKYDKIFVHPNFEVSYDSSGLTQYDYDVALLRLEEIPTIDGKTIQPICLDDEDVLSQDSPTDPDWQGSSFTVAGWGSTDTDPGEISPDLRSTDTPQVSRLQCENMWNTRKACFTTGPAVPSIKHPEQGRGTCSADSGGPYFYKRNGRYIQVAVVNTWEVFIADGSFYCAPALSTHGGTKVDNPAIKQWIKKTCENNQ